MAFDPNSVLTVQPIPGLPDEVNQIRLDTADIVANRIIPLENASWRDESTRKAYQSIVAEVKERKLWAPHLPVEYGGNDLGFLSHAYMNEILAWCGMAAPMFGVVAPNSGNQKVLVKYATPEQKKKWLEPLVRGETQSCYSMTEPDNAGSDPRSIKTSAVKDGDQWVINGRKWFTSNGIRADWALVMCRTEESDGAGGVNEKMSQFIVPTDTPGFEIVRSVPVWGRDGSHCEIIYKDVRVPLDNIIGSEGQGHAAAQERLGAGRVYHCMNSIGHMWRAFDLMVKRAIERDVYQGKLEDKQFIQGFIADSYMDIQASRLMTIHCADLMERGVDARTEISAIKVFVPQAYHRVVDRAIQVFGAKGVSSDTPLAGMWLGARTLRIADGPDEVHKILIAKNVLDRYHDGLSWDFGVC
ncbi:MAG: acyl-CoA dehydrogenase family protein [Pseudomonadales bacterium]|jgi:acyl-CoA dehydrogenase|nr:acyl-CoA dehydrogenase family protein [Pseudomonadales bacterium]|tara:strand:- start:5279 stop:6517 length:1239 start_codon:yes stop_codon:yes gene_type:complete